METEQRVDPVSVDIDQMLALMSPTHSEHCIFRVHSELRRENEEAYDPKTIAIGPYHRGKNNLKAMEEHKYRYLQQFLQLENKSSVDRYIMALRGLEERARKCYAECIYLSSDEFVKMMLLDGCFIIHFLRKFTFTDIRNRDPSDPIFLNYLTRVSIRHDLMLFENQLPFFILDLLMNMTKFPNPEDNIIHLALNCFKGALPSSPNASEASPRISTANVHHILGLVHKIWCSSFAEMLSQRKQENHREDWELIKCTTELHEAGVQFKKSSLTAISLLDIKFENGVMEIPPLNILDETELVFRNLIAYEQCSRGPCMKYVTGYIYFMDCLINSAKDVEKLRHKGIIVNWLGSDEEVSTMFNKLGHNIALSEHNYYSKVFKDLNIHCGKRRNIWLANLRRNYFNSPWSIISFTAAALLLLFTLIQAIFSIMSYVK